MNRENPFTLMYGKIGPSIVNRREETDNLLENFMQKSPTIQAYLITGVRGSGKTVFLRNIVQRFPDDEWIKIDLNPQGALLSVFSEKLFSNGQKAKLFLDWSLSINMPYLTLEIKKGGKFETPEVVAEKLVERIAKTNKRILITIDEVALTQELRVFANFFQAMIGKNQPVFLLMTGIKDNIDGLSNDPGTSFLSRSPKIDIGPLDIGEVGLEYMRILGISVAVAGRMAKFTKGYAFAYQVLGYFFVTLHKQDLDDDLRQRVASYLWSNGYDVIYKGLTEAEKTFCKAMVLSDGTSKGISAKASLSESNYQNYRRRLIDKGLLIGDTYGVVAFALPCFDEYVSYRTILE